MRRREPTTNDKLWQVMKNPCGRPRIFSSPQDMWNKACDYFAWVDANPWQKKSASNGLNDTSKSRTNTVSQRVEVYQRAYTLYGMCAFLGIAKWADTKRNYIEREGFLEVINAIEQVIASQQIDGALLHQFDSNLVARLNGIADKQITEVTGKDGADFSAFPKLTNEDIEMAQRFSDRIPTKPQQ